MEEGIKRRKEGGVGGNKELNGEELEGINKSGHESPDYWDEKVIL